MKTIPSSLIAIIAIAIGFIASGCGDGKPKILEKSLRTLPREIATDDVPVTANEPSATPAVCVQDTDCVAGTVCRDGACVPLETLGAEDEGVAGEEDGEDSSEGAPQIAEFKYRYDQDTKKYTIVVQFNEPIDPVTIQDSLTLVRKSGGDPISIESASRVEPKRVRYVLANRLAFSTEYRATITGIKDLAVPRNEMAAYSTDFRTQRDESESIGNMIQGVGRAMLFACATHTNYQELNQCRGWEEAWEACLENAECRNACEEDSECREALPGSDNPHFSVQETGDNDSSLFIRPISGGERVERSCPSSLGAAVSFSLSEQDHPTLRNELVYRLADIGLGCVPPAHWMAYGNDHSTQVTWLSRIIYRETSMATLPGYTVVGFRFTQLRAEWSADNYFTEASALLQEVKPNGDLVSGSPYEYRLMPPNLPVEGSSLTTQDITCPASAPIVTEVTYFKQDNVIVQLSIKCSRIVKD